MGFWALMGVGGERGDEGKRGEGEKEGKNEGRGEKKGVGEKWSLEREKMWKRLGGIKGGGKKRGERM